MFILKKFPSIQEVEYFIISLLYFKIYKEFENSKTY